MESSLLEVKDYFNMENKEFADAWKELSSNDKQELRELVWQENTKGKALMII